jgi:acid phosphatase
MRGRLFITGALLALGLAGALPAAAYVSSPGVPDAEHATFDEVVEYYEKHYEHDVNRIGRKAKAALVEEVKERRRGDPKPAIVFDIDDTALSLYECEKAAGDFGNTPLIGCVVGAGVETTAGTGKGLPRIEPVYKLYKKAQRLGVGIFFITGRPTLLVDAYKRNLRARGYTGKFELTTYPSQVPPIGVPLAPYKSGARARVERQGYEILLNIGDQVSDLRGGFANRKFLLPNPMYFTP